MKRREFITLLGGAAAWPLGARAQQARGIRRVVVLMGAAETGWSRGWLASFLRRLDELGWREGRNLVTQVQWWNDQPEQMRAWAAELMARTPDVAMAFSNPALAILKPLAGDIPIVFVGVGDPVGSRFVASLARPGGNITGFASHAPSMGGKWLEVLKETAPHVTRVLAIMHVETEVHQAFRQSNRGCCAATGNRDHSGQRAQCRRDRGHHRVFCAEAECRLDRAATRADNF
jgi:putative tryptophan/tyrosine transport system substrate-binding protein